MSTPLATDYCDVGQLVSRCLLQGNGLTVETDLGELDFYGDDLSHAWKDLAPGEAFLPLAVLSGGQNKTQTDDSRDLIAHIEVGHQPALRAFAQLLTTLANASDCCPRLLLNVVTATEGQHASASGTSAKDAYQVVQQTIYCEAMERCLKRWPGYAWDDDDLAYMIAEVAREVPAEA